MIGRQKYKHSEKNLAQGILSTWTTTGLNLDIYSELVTNCHSDTWERVPYPRVCLYSLSVRRATGQDNVQNYFGICWILWKPRL